MHMTIQVSKTCVINTTKLVAVMIKDDEFNFLLQDGIRIKIDRTSPDAIALEDLKKALDIP